MLFSSIEFLCAFLPLFFGCYYAACAISRFAAKRRGGTPRTALRNSVLLVFSLIFYAWGEILYIWLLVGSIIFNYLFALFIDGAARKNIIGLKRLFIVADVALNLSLLGFFKYASFAVDIVNGALSLSLPVPQIVLPIGISFFTFQIMSYVIDVYRGNVPARKNIFTVAVYLCAFPQLIAGPVVRYADVAAALDERTETLDKTVAGLRRFIIGLAKKVLIANTVAAVADGIFKYSPEEFGILGGWVGAVAFTLQIYFDFSGYSDMAIGMGKMMGFDYLENFNFPYSSTSVTDFWRRWHISLSGFFKDYVYIPLGGNRVSTGRWIFNMLLVWSLTGLWHGAALNFIVWGAYYGILLILEKKLYSGFLKKHRIFSRIYTVLSFIFGWVIFRADSFSSLGKTLLAMIGGYGLGIGEITAFTVLRRANAGLYFLIIAVLAAFLSSQPSTKLRRRFLSLAGIPVDGTDLTLTASNDGDKKKKRALSVCISLCDLFSVSLLVLSLVSLAAGAYNPFIYFRF